MDLLLLAAGMGTRLGRYTRYVPKALLPVRGRPLIDHALEHAEALRWVDRVVVVTGCKAGAVRAHLDRRAPSKPVLEAFNPAYEKGNLYSLAAGLGVVGDEWLLMNVDHIYPRVLLERVQGLVRGVTAVCDADRPLSTDCMKVLSRRCSNGARTVVRIGKRLRQHDYGYIGLTFVPATQRRWYLQAVEHVLRRDDPSAVAEMALQEMAGGAGSAAGEPCAHIADASGIGWLEIDDENDLRRAEAAAGELTPTNEMER